MFKNLEKEILKNGHSIEEISKKLNLSFNVLKKKIEGSEQFTVKEIMLLKKIINPELSYEYLFEEF